MADRSALHLVRLLIERLVKLFKVTTRLKCFAYQAYLGKPLRVRKCASRDARATGVGAVRTQNVDHFIGSSHQPRPTL